MRKENITEEKIEAVKRLVHDDPAAMDIVEQFQSAYSATVKRQKRLDIIVDISLAMCLITLAIALYVDFSDSGFNNKVYNLVLMCPPYIFIFIAHIAVRKSVSVTFSRNEIKYVNACLEERCPSMAAQYQIAERSGKFFANVNGEMRLLDKPNPDAAMEEDNYAYYEYPLYHLDEYDGITCQLLGNILPNNQQAAEPQAPAFCAETEAQFPQTPKEERVNHAKR